MYVCFAHVHRRNKQAHSQMATSYVKHCILFIEYAMPSSSPMSTPHVYIVATGIFSFQRLKRQELMRMQQTGS